MSANGGLNLTVTPAWAAVDEQSPDPPPPDSPPSAGLPPPSADVSLFNKPKPPPTRLSSKSAFQKRPPAPTAGRNISKSVQHSRHDTADEPQMAPDLLFGAPPMGSPASVEDARVPLPDKRPSRYELTVIESNLELWDAEETPTKFVKYFWRLFSNEELHQLSDRNGKLIHTTMLSDEYIAITHESPTKWRLIIGDENSIEFYFQTQNASLCQQWIDTLTETCDIPSTNITVDPSVTQQTTTDSAAGNGGLPPPNADFNSTEHSANAPNKGCCVVL